LFSTYFKVFSSYSVLNNSISLCFIAELVALKISVEYFSMYATFANIIKYAW